MPCYYKVTKVNFSKWNHQVVLFFLFIFYFFLNRWYHQHLHKNFISVFFCCFNEPARPPDKASGSFPFWLPQTKAECPLLSPNHFSPTVIKRQPLKFTLHISKPDSSTPKHCWNLILTRTGPQILTVGTFRPFPVSRQFCFLKSHEECTSEDSTATTKLQMYFRSRLFFHKGIFFFTCCFFKHTQKNPKQVH